MIRLNYYICMTSGAILATKGCRGAFGISAGGMLSSLPTPFCAPNRVKLLHCSRVL
jgi:hypothetical protein